MQTFKKAIITILLAGPALFAGVVLYKKQHNRLTTSARDIKYNLPVLSNRQLDTIRLTDPYLYNLHLGVYALEHGTFDSAEIYFRQACQLNPGAAFPNCRLAQAFHAQEKYDSAIFYANRALAIKPNYEAARFFKQDAEENKLNQQR